MEWTENLNSIMAYVESHLDGEMDTEEIGRLALCPFPMFQSRRRLAITWLSMRTHLSIVIFSPAGYNEVTIIYGGWVL